LNGHHHEPEELEQEIEQLRTNLARIGGELDRRRHETLDWRLQARRHARLLAVVASGVGVVAGGLVGYAVWRRQQPARPIHQMRRLKKTAVRMIEPREDIARTRPQVTLRVAGAVLGSIAGSIAKALIQSWLDRPHPARLEAE
jgi:hypothetical protein